MKNQNTKTKKKVVILFSIEKKESIEELSGLMKKQKEENKLMNSVLEGKNAKEGKIIREAVNRGIFSFNPDILFQNITQNYSIAKQIYGETLLRELIGEVDNPNIPEVKRKLNKIIRETIEKLKDKGFLSKEMEITDLGMKLAALSLYTEELDHLISRGLIGERINKRQSHYGEKENIRNFKQGDRYKDIALKKSIKTAIRRMHGEIEENDLKIFKRESRGQIYIIYAIDASGSMKGEKIDFCKKAGIALAYKAISEKDKVGLLVFGSDIEDIIHPTSDFMLLLESIAKIRAKKETDIASTILKSVEIFPSENVTKHLVLITDAVPTAGKEPEKETLDAVSKAAAANITLSVVGINLAEKAKKLAEQITAIGRGRLYTLKTFDNLDSIILEDYYAI